MFQFSQSSLDKLSQVHEDLQRATELALSLSTVDFAVAQGLRTQTAEAEAVASGHSKTMHSRHLDGHAVDLVPVIDGALSWAWPGFFPIVLAMQAASLQLNIPMNWGGCWDKLLTELGPDPRLAMTEYVQREQAENGQAFHPLLDGPHFQLTWEAYP